MKKISLISIFVILAITMLTVVAYADTTGKMEVVADKTEYKNGDQVVVEVKISELESDTGIIGLGGTIEYDKNTLDFEKIEGSGEWGKPTFNEVNGKWISDRSDLTKDKETVFKATFKVKEDADKKVEIKVKEVETSGGAGAFSLSEASTSIDIKKSSSGNGGNNGNNGNGGSGNSGSGSSSSGSGTSLTATNTTNSTISLDKNVNKTASENLPKAGLPAPIVIVLMSGAIVLAFVFYIKFEKVSRKK